MATETKTFYPGAHTGNTFSTINQETNPVGKGASNTTYAKLGLSKTSGAECVIYWPFDVSAIPEEAVIDAVTCKARIANDASSYFSKLQGQLYSGTTAKGTATSYINVSAGGAALTISAGSWTRAELSSCRLRIYAKKQYSSNAPNVYFYGADLTVTYTYQSEKFMLKLFGDYKDISRTFKKVSGIWVEQTDLANVIEDGVRYQNGGEIESAGPTPIPVTITGEGASGYCYATINGTTYISATSGIEVMPGDTVVFCVSKFSGVNGTVTVDGNVVFTASTQGPATYNWTVPDGISSINIALYESASTYHTTVTVTTTSSGGR